MKNCLLIAILVAGTAVADGLKPSQQADPDSLKIMKQATSPTSSPLPSRNSKGNNFTYCKDKQGKKFRTGDPGLEKCLSEFQMQNGHPTAEKSQAEDALKPGVGVELFHIESE